MLRQKSCDHKPPAALAEDVVGRETEWLVFATTPDAIPVNVWQQEELDRRKENLLRNPGSGVT